MTKDAVAKSWFDTLTLDLGRYYSDPDNVPSGPGPDATLWVHPSGNDSLTIAQVRAGGGSPTQSWATLGRAMRGSTVWASPNGSEAAVAGDIVEVADGAYLETSAGTDEGGKATFYPYNSGTSGNPITFRAANRHGARLGLTSPGITLGNYSRDWIVFDGFDFDDSIDDCFGGGGIIYTINGTNITVRNCRFKGITPSATSGLDNYTGVFTSQTDNLLVSNCTFENFGQGVDDGTPGQISANNAGVTCYNHSEGVVVEHCEFTNCGAGVYYKAQTQSASAMTGTGTVRYCKFDTCLQGVVHHRAYHTSSNPFYVYNNLFLDCGYTSFAILGWDDDGTDPRYGYVVNNTIINCGQIGMFGPRANAGFYFANNIISGGVYGITWNASSDGRATNMATFSRNQVNGQSTAAFYADSNKNYAAWQATTGVNDTNSITTAPTFVNAGAGDYRLASNGQTALTQGRVVFSIGGTNGDTIPLGCYITGSEEIGLES